MNYKKLLKKYTGRSKRGLTLVEMVAVIAIMAITSGAVLSVYVMVQKVTNDASEITVNQYNTTQIERLIRNELQVASNVDFDVAASFAPLGVHYDEVEEGDEYMMYDTLRKEVVFKRADSTSTFNDVFTVTDVNEVTFSVSPVNDVTPSDGQHYKLFYKISTGHYDYSGGFVLSNTVVGEDDSMVYAGSTNKKIVWTDGIPNDNDTVFYFHREKSAVESTP